MLFLLLALDWKTLVLMSADLPLQMRWCQKASKEKKHFRLPFVAHGRDVRTMEAWTQASHFPACFAAAIFFGPITNEDGTDASRDFRREGRRQGRSYSVFSQVYLVFYFSSTYKIKQVSLFDIFMGLTAEYPATPKLYL